MNAASHIYDLRDSLSSGFEWGFVVVKVVLALFLLAALMSTLIAWLRQ